MNALGKGMEGWVALHLVMHVAHHCHALVWSRVSFLAASISIVQRHQLHEWVRGIHAIFPERWSIHSHASLAVPLGVTVQQI
jgi:hypothetical protein